MKPPDLAALIDNAQLIVEGIGRESVDVYLFLSDEFRRGPITDNNVFQFVYRSFYCLDNAGLTPDFSLAYFESLERSRAAPEVDLGAISRGLHAIPNRKGDASLQFSFVTKLANTVNPSYPIYDNNIAKVFGFRAPYNYKSFDTRLEEYLAFYGFLREFYEEIIARELMKEMVELFEKTYSPAASRVPSVKILDFMFWSAGKLSGKL